MLREEQVTAGGKSFTVSNKIAVPRSLEHPEGIRYMTDAEFEAHKADQVRGALKALAEQERRRTKEERKAVFVKKLAQMTGLSEGEIEDGLK